ncbi:MAG: hypothetical protein WAM30_10440 [Candidatus Dormiibacterota bacterium]
MASPAVDLAAYRDAVARLVEPISTSGALDERHIRDWLAIPEVTQLLSAVPGGVEGVAGSLTEELRWYWHPAHRCTSRQSPSAWLRIYLLSRIDALWWNSTPEFQTDAEVLAAEGLAEIHQLRRSGRLHFSYHRLPRGLPGRARDWAYRRLLPARRPRTAGLKLTWVRPEMLIALNHLALEFKRAAPAGTPPMWVTSMVRSVEEQHELRALGYPAFVPSSHSSGYAFDVEVHWFARFGARTTLIDLLCEYQRAGAINAIDEGHVWHVCLSPDAVAETRRSDTFALEV